MIFSITNSDILDVTTVIYFLLVQKGKLYCTENKINRSVTFSYCIHFFHQLQSLLIMNVCRSKGSTTCLPIYTDHLSVSSHRGVTDFKTVQFIGPSCMSPHYLVVDCQLTTTTERRRLRSSK